MAELRHSTSLGSRASSSPMKRDGVEDSSPLIPANHLPDDDEHDRHSSKDRDRHLCSHFQYVVTFLKEHGKEVYNEVRAAYIDTMNKVPSANFRAYIQALEKLQLDIATFNDLIGVETRSSGLFARAREPLKNRSETSDRTRQEIYGVGKPAGPPNHPAGIIFPSVPIGSGSDLVPGPAAGVYPSRGDHGIGGSMLIGPNDPRWFGGGVGGEPAFLGGLPPAPYIPHLTV